MYSSLKYLLSGITSLSTGTVSVLGMEKFTITANATSFGSNVATGTLNINGRLDSSADYALITSHAFAGNSGTTRQFDGPWESLQATFNPFTTGTYTVVCRYS
jgi:hypothetical protein